MQPICDPHRPTKPLFRFSPEGLAARWLLLSVVCGVCVLPSAFAQSGGANQGGAPIVHQPADPGNMPTRAVSGDAARIEQMREAERQRRIATDSARLAELSAQLKSELDHVPADQLSVDALRKLAEIEKLTRDLKQWLKG